MNERNDVQNPVIGLDYPDPDVIRVDDTYYMVSTTMHFMPGCEILRSYDLIHWEHVSFVYHSLDHTPAQNLMENRVFMGKECGQHPCDIIKEFFVFVSLQMIHIRRICTGAKV